MALEKQLPGAATTAALVAFSVCVAVLPGLYKDINEVYDLVSASSILLQFICLYVLFILQRDNDLNTRAKHAKRLKLSDRHA